MFLMSVIFQSTPAPEIKPSKPSEERPTEPSKSSKPDPSKAASAAIASVSLTEKASLNDGWGDDDGGGWDDPDADADGDWGSLEEPMKPEKVDNSDDWLGSFNSGGKSHSASMSFNSGVKSHSALSPASPVESKSSDSWGNDWGEVNSNSMGSSDEARKRREEKKAERQKEIEAKRAAKKGPMKLGTKKNLD